MRVAGASAPVSADVQADADSGGQAGEKAAQTARLDRCDLEVEAVLGLRTDRLQGGVEPLAQDPELQGVEDLVDLVAVPLAQVQVVRTQLELDIAAQLGEGAVADNLGHVRA